ncbi:hypothetical protein Tco_1320586 [Tanacetum coccineum]
MLKENFNQLSAMLYEALKEMLPSMVNKEVNKITKTSVIIYVAEGLQLERQKIQAKVAAMISEAIKKEQDNLYVEVISQVNDAIANHIPPQVDSLLRDFRSKNTLYVHPTQTAKANAQDLNQLYLMMRDDKQLRKQERKIDSANSKEESLVVHSCQREPKAPPMTLLNQDQFYSKHESKTVKNIRTTYELGHEHKFITEIIVRRANGKIDPITKPDYKYLSKNDIEDMYLLCINDKVKDYKETGLLGSLKVNLIAPTITFPDIKKEELFNITFRPVIGMIYQNSKKEKRVMIHKEIHKFYDATLNRVLEGLEKYNKDVKYGYANPSPSDADAEYLRFYEEDIRECLRHRDQMRLWEMYLNGRPLRSRRDRP